MTVVGTALVEVRAVTGNVEKDITLALQRALKGAEGKNPIAPRLNPKPLQQDANKLSGIIANLQGRLKLASEAGLSGAGALDELAGKAKAAATALGPLGIGVAVVGLAVGAAAVFAAAGIHNFEKLAESVHEFQLVSGASAEDASRFVVALRVLGAEPDRVGAGLFRLGRQIQDGTSKLGGYGITVGRTKDGNVDLTATFLNVADAVQKASGDGDKASLAFAAFGKQGLALLPILERGKQGLQDLFSAADKNFEVLSQKDIDNAIAYKIQTNQAKESVNGLAVAAGRLVLPSATFIARSVALGLQDLNRFAHDAAGGIAALGRVFGISAGQSNAAANAYAVSAARLQGLVKGVGELETAQFATLSAQDKFADSTLSVTSAQLGLKDAERSLADLQATHGRDVNAISSAQDSLTSSTKALQASRKSLATAEQHLADVRKGAAPRDLQESALQLREATNAVAHAQLNLAAVQKDRKHTALDLSDAQNQLEQSQIDAANAQDELTKTQQKGTDQDPDVIAAQEAVASAHDDVSTAMRNRGKAAADLRTAQQPDPQFEANLEKAVHNVAVAHQQVTDAQDNQVVAGAALYDQQSTMEEVFAKNAASVDLYRIALEELAKAEGISVAALVGPLNKATNTPKVLVGPPNPNGPQFDLKYGGHGASGITTNPGYWYRVNENGTEDFASDSTGKVVPIGGRNSGTAPVQVIQNIHGTDPEATAQRSGYYVGRAIRTAPR